MGRKLVILAGFVALVVSMGGFSLASGRDSTGPTDFSIIATKVVFTTADVGAKGNSPGDELVFTPTDVNLEGQTVGRLDGYCVFTEISGGNDHFEECMLTHTLKGGQITLQGQFDQTATIDNAFAVTGGTGIYSEARSQVILHFLKKFRFNFELE